MKFLVDTQLPPLLAKWIGYRGFDVIHTTNKEEGHLISDIEIIAIAIRKERIIITKDMDFFNYFMVKSFPPKIVLLSLGNIKNRKLLDYFRANFEQIIALLKQNNFVTCNHQIISTL